MKVSRVLVLAAAWIYGVGILANTVLPIHTRSGDRPPWRVFLNLDLLANTETSDIVKNVVLFAPLGVLLPLLFRKASALVVLLMGFLVAFTMEALQLLDAVTGHGGHIADINDLLADTVGVVIGYLFFRAAALLLRVRPRSSRVASHEA